MTMRGMFSCTVAALAVFARADGLDQNLSSSFRPPAVWSADFPEKDGVKPIFYEGVDFKGRPTRIFAYLAIPDVPAGAKVPGMVLVHGGLGSAFRRWAKYWRDLGYAAISMDTCGCVSGNEYGDEQRGHRRHPWSGPSGWGGFADVRSPICDQWPYHALTAVIRANSLLGSLPQVDSSRIGLTGVSWGGYLCCLAASLDDRFAFAAPVYGCGFLENGSVWSRERIDSSTEQEWRLWCSKFDPKNWLFLSKCPFLWIDGSNDFAFPLSALQQSVDAVSRPHYRATHVRMPHGHDDFSEHPKELVDFAAAMLKGDKAYPYCMSQRAVNGRISAKFMPEGCELARAELEFTLDGGRWQDRYWRSVPATLEVENGNVSADLPAGTRAWYVNVFTTDGKCISSDVSLIGEAPSERIYFKGDTASFALSSGTDWHVEDDLGTRLLAGCCDTNVVDVSHASLQSRFGAFRFVSGSNATWFAFLSSPNVKPCPWVGTGGHWGHGWGMRDKRFVNMLAAAGIGVVRDEPLWSRTETRRGVYEPLPAFEEYVDDLCERGIRMNMVMNYGNGIYENPLDPEAFSRWCSWMAEHYRGRVDRFEIWNEAENFFFVNQYGNGGNPPNWMAKLIELTHMASDAIRTANPGAVVAVAAEDKDFCLKKMIQNGIARKHEVISFHPYCHRQHRPEREFFLNDFGKGWRALAERHGGAAGWIVTEAGWTTYEGKGEFWEIAGSYPRSSYSGQADCIVRMYLAAKASGCEFACQYDFRNDGENPCAAEDNFGVVNRDFTPKPAFAAIAAMTRILEDAEFVAERSDDPTRYRAPEFKKGVFRIIPCWSVEGSCEWVMPADVANADIRALDLMQNKIAVPIVSNRCVRLVERPVYLVLRTKK